MPHKTDAAKKAYMKKYSQEYYKRHKARIKVQHAAWYRAHREAILAGMKTWYASGRERISASRQITTNRRKGITPTRKAPKLCESCGRRPSGKGRLHVDHSHTSGSFRGWLCFRCNVGLGLLGDSVRAVRKALRYLERSS